VGKNCIVILLFGIVVINSKCHYLLNRYLPVESVAIIENIHRKRSFDDVRSNVCLDDLSELAYEQKHIKGIGCYQ